MKIVAIIDSYNSEKYIGEAIESILDQVRKSDEFLIFDEASTDSIIELINTYE